MYSKEKLCNMEKALAVANYFIEKGIQDRKPVSPMKLQKLIYFSHGWCLALYDTPLIDEAVQAWPYGPVIPSVYHEFKHYGNKEIKSPYVNIMDDAPTVTNPDTIALLDSMWNLYSDLTATQLSNLTHEVDTPWDQLYRDYHAKGLSIPKGMSLDEEKIKTYFKTEYGKLEQA
jgi:uncharacterized phage-associated protein